MLQIYVFSNGDVAREIFNSVAAVMSSNGYKPVLTIAGIFAVLGSGFQYVTTRNLKVFAKFFATYLVMTTILLGIKTNVQIVDASNRMEPLFVDNVPYGLAAPASFITSISYGVTALLESVFHTVDDLQYTETGMLFGSKIFDAVHNSAVIPNSETQGQVNEFLRQCIVPDVMMNHKYTFQQLFDSPDMFAFLSDESMSPIRGIYIDGTFATCKAALPIIQKKVAAGLPEESSWLATTLFGNNNAAASQFDSNLQNSYQYLTGLSEDAQNILLQNTMVSAIRSGIGGMLASGNAPAALINLGQNMATQQQIISDNVMAQMAITQLPMMQTAMILILICLFPIIALLMFHPTLFVKIGRHYLNTVVVICTWPIIFCVINWVMTAALSQFMSGVAIANGGISLSNSNQLEHQAVIFAAICGGMLAAGVPLLSFMIYKGMDGAFMTASQSIFGSMQSMASGVSSGLSSGNISLANTSMGNHSWNNISANKHDTNATEFSGMRSVQLGSGAVETTTQSGQHVFNTQSATSSLATNVNWGRSLSSSFQRSHDTSLQAAQSERVSMDSSISSAASTMQSLSAQQGTNQSYGTGHSAGQVTSVDQAVSGMVSTAQEYAKTNGITESEAMHRLTKVGLSENLQFNTGSALWGKGVALATGVTGGINASADQSMSSDGQHGYNEGVNNSENTRLAKDFRTNMNYAINHSENLHSESGASQSQSLSNQVAADLRQAQTSAQQSSADFSQANRYSEMANFSEQNSASLSENLNQQYVGYVEKVNPQHAQEILSNTSDPAIAAQRTQLANQFIESHRGELEQTLQSSMATNGTPGSFYQGSKDALVNASDNVRSNFNDNSTKVSAAGAGTAFSEQKMNAVADSVSAAQTGNQNILAQEGQQQTAQQQAFKSSAESTIDQGHTVAGRGVLASGLGESFTPAAYFETKQGLLTPDQLKKEMKK